MFQGDEPVDHFKYFKENYKLFKFTSINKILNLISKVEDEDEFCQKIV